LNQNVATSPQNRGFLPVCGANKAASGPENGVRMDEIGQILVIVKIRSGVVKYWKQFCRSDLNC
jgi:hypothetical protein